ncbi:MAG: DNA polymerase I [Bacteroidota bacterium]
MAEKKLFLLDAYALLYRAHFAFIKNPRLNSKGENTSAVFGFVLTLLGIIEKERPTHLAVAFDLSGPTFRHEMFPEYKANREEMPEDIRMGIPMARRLLKALNIPILQWEGYEADDVIGTISKRAEKNGFQVFMVTPDKDYAQLVTENVFLYKPSRAGNGIEIYDREMVEKKFGVPPEHVVDFLGLKGDKVDNIPGIPRVGDKTAAQLINAFGTVEEIIARAEEITKPSIRKTVTENAEQGRLSKVLATIETEVPMPFDEDHCKIGDPDREATTEIIAELEFRNTGNRILNSPIFRGHPDEAKDLFGNPVAGSAPSTAAGATTDAAPAEEPSYETIESRAHNYIHVKTDAELAQVIADVKAAGSFCFDTETTGLNPMAAEIIALTVSLAPGTAYMVYFPEGDTESLQQLETLKEILESTEIVKVGQNLKYDMLLLKNYGVDVCEPLYDTMLAHYVVNPDLAHGMDAMARELLNYQPVSIVSLIGKKGKKQLSMRDVPLDKLLEYACEDADITLAIKEKLDPAVDAGNVRKVLETVELPLVPALTQVEFNGVKVDEGFLREYSKELETEMLKIEQEIYNMAGREFNINSPKQLGEIIFDELKLGKARKTRTGQYSTREEELVKLADKHDFPAYVLRYRKLGKLKSTYVDALPALVNEKTGRIHSTLSQAVTATGRLSSNNPNLQNIPIRTDEGREIRKAFIAEDGYTFMAADYSQVELRLMAELSQSPAMLEAFLEKQDIHRATAARVFGVGMDDVDGDMRAKAKMVNFGIIYGISAFGLAQRLKIRRSEAAEIIDSYFATYPQVKAYMDASIDQARDHGYAETIMGRRRYLPNINSGNATVKGFAERNAINTPVQGSAADLIKIAMINIYREMKQRKLKSRMILQVHDELVFEAHKDEIEELSVLVKDLMENAVDFKVPMEVEIGLGKNWLEAH